MKLELDFEIENNILTLPTAHSHIIQSFIYNNLYEDYRKFLYEKGYEYKDRTFKLFTFSRIIGDYSIYRKDHEIRFNDNFKIYINSPSDRFCSNLLNNLIKNTNLRIFDSKVKLKNFNLSEINIEKKPLKLKTLSPITIYSTFKKPNNKKYTKYYEPGSDLYEDLISSNLQKKYRAFKNENASERNITIKKLNDGKMAVIRYKGFIIKGWLGMLEVNGPTELLKMGVEAGYGGKNSQGCGYVEIIRS